jgi:predicted DNA-binding protein YlxM (UPF0122 family)
MTDTLKELYTELKSIKKMSILLNRSRDQISKELRSLDVLLPNKKNGVGHAEELVMIQMYVEENKSMREIAEHFGVERRLVSKRLKKHNVTIRANLPYNFPEEVYQDWADQYALGFSYQHIANSYGVCRETVRDYLRNKKKIPSRVSLKIFPLETYKIWTELYLHGATLEEIAIQFDVTNSTVAKHLEELGVERRNGYTFPETVYDEWVEMYEDGFTTREIGDQYGVTKFPVSFHLKRKGVRMRESWEWHLSKPHLMDVEPSEEQKQVILGSVFGDGTIFDQSKGAYLRIKHKEGQKEYLEYKMNILGEFISNAQLVDTDTVSNEKSFSQVYGCTVPNMYIKSLRNLSYKSGKRIIKDLIPYLEPLGLAILWCDDGHYMKKKSGSLYTLNFSWEDNQLLASHLDNKFGIECKVSKRVDKKYNKSYPYIYITVKGMKVMKEVIREYIPSSMMYKIGE